MPSKPPPHDDELFVAHGVSAATPPTVSWRVVLEDEDLSKTGRVAAYVRADGVSDSVEPVIAALAAVCSRCD